jgi:putative salt-induced outer membrane protein YdiY
VLRCGGIVGCLLLLVSPAVAVAQDCPCPKAATPGWHGSLGAGLALTNGNSNSRNVNASLQLTYDPKRRNVVKIDGLYLHASSEGVDTANNSAFGVRDEYSRNRVYLFAETRYQGDTFKDLTYLITPAVGAGYKLVASDAVTWGWDAGFGIAFEKLEDRASSTTSGALQTAEALTWTVSPTAKLTHVARAIWKTTDFSDAFYHFEADITAAVIQRLELKLGGIEDIKNKPASPALKKHDEKLLASVLFKF